MGFDQVSVEPVIACGDGCVGGKDIADDAGFAGGGEGIALLGH
jgi:hypothetical protein